VNPGAGRRSLRRLLAIGVVAIALLAGVIGSGQTAVASPVTPKSGKPTIVLVHGAWADGSSFAPVTALLKASGYPVKIAPNPLRGLAIDAPALVQYVQQQTKGPVVLVGHSYGGFVISNAAGALPQVKALVYIDAYAPDAGETVLGLTNAQPGSALHVDDPTTVFDFVPYAGAPDGDYNTTVKPAVFESAFVGDLPKAARTYLARHQSPITLFGLNTPSATAAWKTIPSTFFIGTNDKVLPPAQQRVMAKRANATVFEGPATHVAMLSKPLLVTKAILSAASTCR
jgi:pimeloyl-ACP methyl ester carboxylesterase